MSPVQQFEWLFVAGALALGVAALLVTMFRGFGRHANDLPPDLLDDLSVKPAGEWLELRGRLYGGKRLGFKVDRRHAHVLSDELLRATMKHYGAKLNGDAKGNDGTPPLSS